MLRSREKRVLLKAGRSCPVELLLRPLGSQAHPAPACALEGWSRWGWFWESQWKLMALDCYLWDRLTLIPATHGNMENKPLSPFSGLPNCLSWLFLEKWTETQLAVWKCSLQDPAPGSQSGIQRGFLEWELINNQQIWHTFFSLYFKLTIFFLKNFLYLFLERGERGRKKRREISSVWLPLMAPQLGTWPTTQACALTGNWTCNLWFTGWCSIHWATPARAQTLYILKL